MTEERVKAAAQWAKQMADEEHARRAENGIELPRDEEHLDAAHILGLLASGRAVLAEAGPATWVRPDHLSLAARAPHMGRLHPTKMAPDLLPLHAPLDPWSTT